MTHPSNAAPMMTSPQNGKNLMNERKNPHTLLLAQDGLQIRNQIQLFSMFSSLCRAPVFTDRKSASDIRLAEIEIGGATMLVYFKIKKRNLYVNFTCGMVYKMKVYTPHLTLDERNV